MKIFIRAASNISPQKTFRNECFLEEIVTYNVNNLKAIEPDYNKIFDAKMLRRMSRILRMGVAAAKECLDIANNIFPDAIVTGTAYGCLEDTETFLGRMIEQNEEMLSPTAFIQSTHNTVGAQIALMLKCHEYNNTFVHGGHSFESALLDAMLLIQEKEANNVLVGSVDESTNFSHLIKSRFDIYKTGEISNLNLFDGKSKGTIDGEGAAFFMLSNQSSEKNLAEIKALETFINLKGFSEVEQHIHSFLKDESLEIADIDLLVLGKNGDEKNDAVYAFLENDIFKNNSTIYYKHFCGEYPTSVSFALWLSANIIKNNKVPATLNVSKDAGMDFKNMLIYNHYKNIHHSLQLVCSCAIDKTK